MGFKDMNLKAVYDSDEDDILCNFYIPVISSAIRYDRLAGYFSSTILAMSARGMASFIRNCGRMRLVTCMQISEQDRKAIEAGLTRPEEVISGLVMRELDLADQIKRDHVAALAWMVARGNLEIKIAVPLAEDGGYFTGNLDKNSLYHQKIGVLYDSDDNVVSFSGSVNETGRAWTTNIEEFKVFCSWKPGQDEFGSSDAKKFEKFWHNRARNTMVFDLPTAVKERLITDAPKFIEDATSGIQSDAITTLTLRNYQVDAVNEWIQNNRHGIFEMATGTGKTRAAIACIKHVLESAAGQVLVVIACPYKHLLTQWIDELAEWNITSKPAYDASASWEIDLHNNIIHLNDGVLKRMVIVTTHDTFSSPKFINMVTKCRVNSFVVVDEVHKIGAEHPSEGLVGEYDYRLGLSATPRRYLDDDGTKRIFDFFGGVVFEFGIDNAIRHGHLTHYLLYPHIVYMTDEEADKYHSISRRIAIELSKDRPDKYRLMQMANTRSKIIKTAKNKIEEFRKIVRDHGPLDHCLVYCVDKQIDDAASVLHDEGIVYHRFTFREEKQERDALLAEFDRGDKAVLLAIKCLDEGVDVPSTKMAIILASSHNPIEFVQRRGRILRPHSRKDRAVIHDLIVLPRTLPKNQIHTESENAIIRRELARLAEFARSSDNPDHSKDVISTFMNRYGL